MWRVLCLMGKRPLPKRFGWLVTAIPRAPLLMLGRPPSLAKKQSLEFKSSMLTGFIRLFPYIPIPTHKIPFFQAVPHLYLMLCRYKVFNKAKIKMEFYTWSSVISSLQERRLFVRNHLKALVACIAWVGNDPLMDLILFIILLMDFSGNQSQVKHK